MSQAQDEQVNRADTDFSDYVGARWSTFYRTAYVLGAGSRTAEDLAEAALAKAYVAWPQLRVSQDADAYVRAAMLSAHASWRTRRAWAAESATLEVPAPVVDDTLPAADGAAVLDALLALPPGQRAVMLFRCFHDLRMAEVAELLGWSSSMVATLAQQATRTLETLLTDAAMPARLGVSSEAAPLRQDLRVAVRSGVSEVPVHPMRTDRALSAGRSRRRRRGAAVLGAVAVAGAAVLAVALSWGDAEPAGPAPVPVERPAVSWAELDVPWIDDRSIVYGGARTARPPELVALAVTADSTVMTIGRGPVTVAELRPDGKRTVIGRDAVGIALGDAAGHWAAWTEVTGARTARIVLYDTALHEIVATTSVARGMQVYAMDGQTLVLSDGKNEYIWRPGSAEGLVPFGPGAEGQVVTDLTANHVFVTDFGSGSQLLDRDGAAVASFPAARFSAGTFDPSGRFISGLRPENTSGGMNVYDVARDELIVMKVPGDVGWSRWAPDGRLVLRTTPLDDRLFHGDTPVNYFACEPSDGLCLPLPDGGVTLRQAEGVDVGYLGQLTMTVGS